MFIASICGSRRIRRNRHLKWLVLSDQRHKGSQSWLFGRREILTQRRNDAKIKENEIGKVATA
jgi:hypothetical protein